MTQKIALGLLALGLWLPACLADSPSDPEVGPELDSARFHDPSDGSKTGELCCVEYEKGWGEDFCGQYNDAGDCCQQTNGDLVECASCSVPDSQTCSDDEATAPEPPPWQLPGPYPTGGGTGLN